MPSSEMTEIRSMSEVARAKMIHGLRFLHVLAPCSSGWKYEPDLTIHLAPIE